MTDQTPSPQSVVVPMFDDTKIEALAEKYGEINCTYDDGAGHISDLSAFCEEVAGLPNTTKSRIASGFYRVIERLGGVSDTLSIAGSYGDTLTDYQVADELEAMLAAAPAPSSLAGGEVDETIRTAWGGAMTVACNIAIDEQNRTNDDDGPSDVLNAQGEIIRRLKAVLEIDAPYLAEVKAALSPEAPRERGEFPKQCDLPPDGWTCTRAKGHEGPCAAHTDDCRTGSPIASVRDQGCDCDYYDRAALTPRHEAPADCPKCGGTHTRDRIDHGCGGLPVPSKGAWDNELRMFGRAKSNESTGTSKVEKA